MALAETFLRKIHKLGVLPKIVKLLPKISFLLAAISVLWLLILPSDGNYRNTYISENALMPGQVTSYFRESEWNYVRGFRMETKYWDFENSHKSHPSLESWLSNLGLKVSYHYDEASNSTILYAIMHATRGDNTEAVVLVTPYMTSTNQPNIGGFALAPTLARYFSRMSIWSKNIIFVFPPDNGVALRNWVEAYHTSLDLTAGSIEAAIVMEYPEDSDNFDHMKVFYEGLNGQLPNLDFFNVVQTISRNENIKLNIQNTPLGQIEQNNYYTRLRTLASGILNLATAGLKSVSPGCEAFSGWQIQAVTIQAVGTGGPDITQFGRIVDSTFRSVNNLLEKFHQSFFFYLLLSPTNFVSIGTYLPSAVLLAVAFAVSSLCCLANGVTGSQYLSGIGSLLGSFTAIELLCLVLALILPSTVDRASNEISLTSIVFIALLIVTTLLSFKPLLRTTLSFRFSETTTHLLVAFSLYFIAMLITTLLIVHYALAFTIGLCTLPLTFIQPLTSLALANKEPIAKAELKITLCLLASSPITVIACLGWFLEGGSYNGILHFFSTLLTSWRDVQCWTWFVIALGWLPAWLTIALASTLGNFQKKGGRKGSQKYWDSE